MSSHHMQVIVVNFTEGESAEATAEEEWGDCCQCRRVWAHHLPVLNRQRADLYIFKPQRCFRRMMQVEAQWLTLTNKCCPHWKRLHFIIRHEEKISLEMSDVKREPEVIDLGATKTNSERVVLPAADSAGNFKLKCAHFWIAIFHF